MSHCGLIANRGSRTNRDISSIRNMKCCFARCAAMMIIILRLIMNIAKNDNDNNNDDSDNKKDKHGTRHRGYCVKASRKCPLDNNIPVAHNPSKSILRDRVDFVARSLPSCSGKCSLPNKKTCELSSPSLPRRNASVRFIVTVESAANRTAYAIDRSAVSLSVDISANTVNTSATVSGCLRAIMHITETRVANVGAAACRAMKVASTASFRQIAAISFL